MESTGGVKGQSGGQIVFSLIGQSLQGENKESRKREVTVVWKFRWGCVQGTETFKAAAQQNWDFRAAKCLKPAAGVYIWTHLRGFLSRRLSKEGSWSSLNEF